MIDYAKLAHSNWFYEERGFKRIEAPWTVTHAVSAITKPEGCSDWTITEKNKVLVASGEQSFLYLYLKGFLPAGKFQTVTPCFRDESFDLTHTKYFIKNELIDTDFTTESEEAKLNSMIKNAADFFNRYCPNRVHIVKISDEAYDICYKGKELGSYGIRSCDFLKWVYGTGISLPRLDMVLNSKT